MYIFIIILIIILIFIIIFKYYINNHNTKNYLLNEKSCTLENYDNLNKFKIRKFMENENNYLPIEKCCTLENYNNLNRFNIKEFMKNKNNYSLCDKKIFDFVKNNFTGNGVLIGVWRGGLAIWMRKYMNENDYLYLFDTFEDGFKYSKKYDEYYFPSMDEVKKNFNKFNIKTTNIIWNKGDIKKTIQKLNKKINFAYIDVDIYEPTLYSLVGTYLNLNVNGICAIDDYGVDFFDAKEAVDVFFKWYKIESFKKINEYAIYFIKKSNNFKTNNVKLIYNFYCHYNNNPTLNYELSSVSILEMIYNYYRVPNRLIEFTKDLQNQIGINNTIWGIKKDKNNDSVSWEYYYYGWDIDNPGSLLGLFDNNRNLSNFNKIYHKYFNKTISFDYELENSVVIYSVDINTEIFNDPNKSENIVHLYTNFTDTNKLIEVSKLKTYEYDYNKKTKIFESESETWIVKNTPWEKIYKILVSYGISNNYDILKNFYENSRYFAILIKHKKNKIGIYFHCIKYDYFLFFLKIAKFKDDFIEYFVIHKYYLNNISLEIAMDYDPELNEFVRFAFYGSV